MSAPSLAKRFEVIFMASNCYKITLEAASASQAIAKAQRLWQRGKDQPFTCYAGDTDAWDAEEVRS